MTGKVKTIVVEENLFQYYFVAHKFNTHYVVGYLPSMPTGNANGV